MAKEHYDEFTFHGGPNDGLKLWLRYNPSQVHLCLGCDRYTIRQHDRILLFAGYPDDLRHLSKRPDEYANPVRSEP